MIMNQHPSNTRKPANIGGIEGDVYLNDRLKNLEIQRAQIHAMADRYGLLNHPQHNGIKVAKFTLLTLYHPGRSNH